MKIPRLLLGLVFAMLAGCQGYTFSSDDPRSVPAIESVMVLNQAINFRVGSSRSYIQHGVAQSSGGINIRKPYCLFYLYEPAAALKHERTIQPDRFTVTRATQGLEYASVKPVVQARMVVPMSDVADGASAHTLTTTIRLKSDNQPQVREMRCSIFGEANLYDYLSVDQIIQTLGSVVTIEMHGKTSG